MTIRTLLAVLLGVFLTTSLVVTTKLHDIEADLQRIASLMSLYAPARPPTSLPPLALDTGYVQGATRDTLTLRDGVTAFPDDVLTGAVCLITSGAGSGQARQVKKQRGNVITVEPWAVEPAPSSTYTCFTGAP